MGNQCTTVDMEPEPLVKIYLTKAGQLKEDGDLEGAIKTLETAKEISTKMHVHNIIDDQISELEQQIAELKLQVENQQAVIANYRSSAIPPQQIDSHLDELYTLLEEQSRDEAWAYQVETAMSDFLIMADLPVQPQLSVSTCKSSVCQFKLLQPEDVDDLPSHYWRNMTDKMMEQSWWKQFKFTSTTSSDDSLTIIASTQ